MDINDKRIHRVLSVILIALFLIFIIAIIANAGNPKDQNSNSGDTDEIIGDADKNGDDIEGNDGTVDNITPDSPGDDLNTEETDNPYIPLFVNYLTGLECTEDIAYKVPYIFVSEPLAPIYGISDSEITVEIPIENGNTRFLIYRTDISELGKIGSLTKTRDYMTVISNFFGGIVSAYGCDDIVSYQTPSSSFHLDLSNHQDKIYKENGKNIYIDNIGIKNAAESEYINTDSYKTQNMPFEFCEFGNTILGKTSSYTVTLPYSNLNSTYLKFNETNNKYQLYKGERLKIDMLTGETAAYTNVFVLFADALTYEMSSGTQTVIETAKKGSGYYLTSGTLTEIRWEVDENSNLIFKDLTGNKLTVNRGNSYIGYYKSADASSVIFE